MHNRPEKIGEAIQAIVSDLLLRRLKDPRVGFVTITGVDVTRDLSLAKIYFSVMGDEEQRKNTQQGLKSAIGFIRTEIGKQLRLRHVPEILFRFDESVERGSRIEQLLKELHED